ncbi:MAG: hypothetical protein Pg6B_04310 [Candidatus Azobacteroides pseudotrichonymphae]|jgi:hypothetical protein|uniref:hypothetical protein n=1 Tax=Candidatus Azobacteroides pseudotrichonymphae TaxID=511435 RepID=UPI0003153EF1|nr:hypothetical protein [Candidatus Azobacteroides pseudotrichonymphae]MDR0530403.1 hypothetical protein [Bacteroidales bacterium OttesenSCG-928-I14]GMO33894.1 MAG: hypothetical protein Pg6B_04310 [Candidatus Azobacteroides pseudotrichonymphae]
MKEKAKELSQHLSELIDKEVYIDHILQNKIGEPFSSLIIQRDNLNDRNSIWLRDLKGKEREVLKLIDDILKEKIKEKSEQLLKVLQQLL